MAKAFQRLHLTLFQRKSTQRSFHQPLTQKTRSSGYLKSYSNRNDPTRNFHSYRPIPSVLYQQDRLISHSYLLTLRPTSSNLHSRYFINPKFEIKMNSIKWTMISNYSSSYFHTLERHRAYSFIFTQPHFESLSLRNGLMDNRFSFIEKSSLFCLGLHCKARDRNRNELNHHVPNINGKQQHENKNIEEKVSSHNLKGVKVVKKFRMKIESQVWYYKRDI